jgi:hypothetical protein
MNTATEANLAAVRYHCARAAKRAVERPARLTTATVTLSIPLGYPRTDQPLFLDRDTIDEIEFRYDADQCDVDEAMLDAFRAHGYDHAAQYNWIREGEREWRAVVEGTLIYIAEVEVAS